MTRPCLPAWDPEGLVLRLLRRWLQARGTVSDDAYFWALPEEASSEAWTSALINAWLQEILSVLQVQPPLAWSSHSLSPKSAQRRSLRCLCSRRGPPHHYELGLVVYPRLPAPLCGRASTAGPSCGLVLWPFVARSMPPPWCSSLVRSCLYVLSTLVLCVCLLCSAHALACQTPPWAVLLLWHSLYCQ